MSDDGWGETPEAPKQFLNDAARPGFVSATFTGSRFSTGTTNTENSMALSGFGSEAPMSAGSGIIASSFVSTGVNPNTGLEHGRRSAFQGNNALTSINSGFNTVSGFGSKTAGGFGSISTTTAETSVIREGNTFDKFQTEDFRRFDQTIDGNFMSSISSNFGSGATDGRFAGSLRSCFSGNNGIGSGVSNFHSGAGGLGGAFKKNPIGRDNEQQPNKIMNYENKNKNPLTCFNCNKEGHHFKECTNPSKPRDGKSFSTFVPEYEAEENLFNMGVHRGALFERLYEADTSVIRGGNSSDKIQTETFTRFDQLELGEKVENNLKLCDYTKPTPVQQKCMPIIHSGFDILACAQTGSGKTAAYLLPIISRLWKDGDLDTGADARCHPRAVILVPTRELAAQVHNEARKYAFQTVIQCKAVYGGTAVSYLKSELAKGATIISATLGRLNHFLSDGTISLDKLRFFVLDEVDRLLDQDGDQIINKIYEQIPHKKKVQGIMFSATLPAAVQTQAQTILKPEYMMVTVDEIGAANKCITQDFILVTPEIDKEKVLLENILQVDTRDYSIKEGSTIFDKKTLIFVANKKFADCLGAKLCHSGIPTTTLHSDRGQSERNEAMRDFMFGRKAVMVATAVMERGLDIKGVDTVVNFDMPDEIDQYVHRIGRTGRVGNAGNAISFYSPDKDRQLAKGLVACLERAQQVIPEFLKLEADNSRSSVDTPSAKPLATEDDDW